MPDAALPTNTPRTNSLALRRSNERDQLHGETKEGQKNRRFTFKLRTAVIFAVLVSTFLAAFVMHFGWRLFVTQELNKFVGVLNREIIRSVRRELNSVFARAIALQGGVRNIFQLGILDPSDPQDIHGLYLGVLGSTEYTWLSYGLPNGNFYGARQLSNQSVQWVESVYDKDNQSASRTIVEYSVVPSGLEIEGVTNLTNTYFSPQRSWYRLATEQPGKHIWTPIYIFSTSGRPGINSAITLSDSSGNTTGVISIATELDRISDFLADLRISENGAALVLNSEREIVAFPDKREVIISNEENIGDSIQYSFNDSCQCWEFQTLTRPGLQLRNIVHGNDVRLKVVNAAIDAQAIELVSIEEFERSQETLYSYEGEEYLVVFDQVSSAARANADQEQSTFNSVAGLSDLGWYVGAVIPSNDIIGGIQRESFNLLAITYSAVFAFIILVLISTNRLIIRPINLLTKQAEYIRKFDLDLVKLPESSVQEINHLIGSIGRMNSGLSSFRKYVPTELVQQLITQGIEARLGGKNNEITIFFCDISSFTRISEAMGVEIVGHLDTYFSHFSGIINDCNGTIDKYIGDAIMAFWGAPLMQKDHAVGACRAALLCERTLSRLRTGWKDAGQEPFFARYGVNTGRVLVGNFGSNLRMSYTAIGDPVNVASRLEALNKTYGTTILIGEETYKQVHTHFVTRHLDRVAVYGKLDAMEVYELVDTKDNDYHSDDYRWVKSFEEGLVLYRKRQWSAAAEKFHAVRDLKKQDDTPSTLFIRRCVHLEKQPVPENWDGTFVLKSK